MRTLCLLLLLWTAPALAQITSTGSPRPNPTREDVAASYTATPVPLGALGSCAALAGTFASVDSTTAQPHYCDGVEWIRILTEKDLNGDVDIGPRGVIAQAGSGERAFAATHGGARWDFGPSTGDDECAYGSASGNGFSSVECGNFTFSQAQFGQIAPRGTLTYIPIVASDGMKWFGFGLGTCNASKERALVIPSDSGGTTGHRTRMCLCASDGAATPAYYWVNSAGTPGTSTTCPFLEP